MCASPTPVFSLYNEMIMQSLEGYIGIKVRGHNVNNLIYAVDNLFIAEKKKTCNNY